MLSSPVMLSVVEARYQGVACFDYAQQDNVSYGLQFRFDFSCPDSTLPPSPKQRKTHLPKHTLSRNLTHSAGSF